MKRLLTVIATIVLAITAMADNRIYIEDAEQYLDQTLSLPVYLSNTDEVTAFQFDVTIPEGYTLRDEAFTIIGTAHASHALNFREIGANVYRVLCYAPDNLRTFKFDKEALVSINVAPTTLTGNYTISLSNIEMSGPNMEKYTCAGSEATVTVENYAEGELGTCIWYIDAEGTLVIAPKDGVSGELPESFTTQDGMYPTPWYEFAEKILSARIMPGVNAKTCENMFFGLEKMVSVDLSGLNTENVTDMDFMFISCTSLESVDFGSLNTQNVTSMGYMFNHCSSLTALDVSSLNTENVTFMNSMFNDCPSLTTLNLSNFTTQNVEEMMGLFYNSNNISTIISDNTTPSPLKAGTFETLENRANCTLKVPVGSKELYAAATGWNELGTIIDGNEETVAYEQYTETYNGAVASLEDAKNQTINNELYSDPKYADIVAEYNQRFDDILAAINDINQQAEAAKNDGNMAEKLDELNALLEQAEANINSTVSEFLAAVAALDAELANTSAYNQFTEEYNQTVATLDNAKLQTVDNEAYGDEKYADIVAEYNQRFDDILAAINDINQQAEAAKNDGNMAEKLDELNALLEQAEANINSTVSEFLAAVAALDADAANTAAYDQFAQKHNQIADKLTTAKLQTINSDVYGEEKYAEIVEEYTQAFANIQDDLADIAQQAETARAEGKMVEKLNELTTLLDQADANISNTVNDFLAAVAEFDADAANTAAYDQFTQKYNQTSEKLTTAKLQTVNNDVYGEEKYAEIVEEYTQAFANIQDDLADIAQQAETAKAEGKMVEKLNELTVRLDQADANISSTVSDFLAAVAEFDADAANTAAYDQFAQKYNQTSEKLTTAKLQTVNSDVYGEEKYAEIVAEYTQAFGTIQYNLADIAQQAETAKSEGKMAEKLNELTTLLDQADANISNTVNDFLAAVAEFDADAANNAAYNQLIQKYDQTVDKLTTAKLQTINNDVYGDEKYAEIVAEYTQTFGTIQDNLAEIAQQAETAKNNGQMVEKLNELTTALDQTDANITNTVNDFLAAVAEFDADAANTAAYDQFTQKYNQTSEKLTTAKLQTVNNDVYGEEKYAEIVAEYTQAFVNIQDNLADIAQQAETAKNNGLMVEKLNELTTALDQTDANITNTVNDFLAAVAEFDADAANTAAYDQFTQKYNQTAEKLTTAKLQTVNNDVYGEEKYAEIVAEYTQAFGTIQDNLADIAQQAETAKNNGQMVEKLNELTTLLDQVDAKINSTVNDFLAAVAEFDADAANTAAYNQFTQKYDQTADKLTTAKLQTINSDVYGEEKYAEIVAEYTQSFATIQDNLADIAQQAETAKNNGQMVEKLNELTTALDQADANISSTVNDFLAAVAEFDADAANTAAYDQFTQKYNQTEEKLTTAKLQTINNDVYGDEKYAEIVDEYTQAFVNIQDNLADIAQQAETAKNNGLMVEKLNELTTLLDQADANINSTVNDFLAAVAALDADAANTAAYNQFIQKYDQTADKLTTAKLQTINNDIYGEEKYAEIVAEYTQAFANIQDNLADIAQQAETAKAEGKMVEKLNELTTALDQADANISNTVNDFLAAVAAFDADAANTAAYDQFTQKYNQTSEKLTTAKLQTVNNDVYGEEKYAEIVAEYTQAFGTIQDNLADIGQQAETAKAEGKMVEKLNELTSLLDQADANITNTVNDFLATVAEFDADAANTAAYDQFTQKYNQTSDKLTTAKLQTINSDVYGDEKYAEIVAEYTQAFGTIQDNLADIAQQAETAKAEGKMVEKLSGLTSLLDQVDANINSTVNDFLAAVAEFDADAANTAAYDQFTQKYNQTSDKLTTAKLQTINSDVYGEEKYAEIVAEYTQTFGTIQDNLADIAQQAETAKAEGKMTERLNALTTLLDQADANINSTVNDFLAAIAEFDADAANTAAYNQFTQKYDQTADKLTTAKLQTVNNDVYGEEKYAEIVAEYTQAFANIQDNLADIAQQAETAKAEGKMAEKLNELTTLLDQADANISNTVNDFLAAVAEFDADAANTAAYNQFIQKYDQTADKLTTAKLQTINNDVYGEEKYAEIVAEYTQVFGTIQDNLADIAQQAETAKAEGKMVEKLNELTVRLDQADANISSTVSDFLAAVAEFDADAANTAAYDQFTQKYNQTSEKLTTAKLQTVNNDAYSDEKYAEIVAEYTQAFVNIQDNLADIAQQAETAKNNGLMVEKLNELTTALDQVNERINSTVSDFLAAVAEFDADAANTAAYDQFTQKYNQTEEKLTTAKLQTINNDVYGEEKYAEIVAEYTQTFATIQDNLADIAQQAETAKAEGKMVEKLNELTTLLDQADANINSTVNDFLAAVAALDAALDADAANTAAFNQFAQMYDQIADRLITAKLQTINSDVYGEEKYAEIVAEYTQVFGTIQDNLADISQQAETAKADSKMVEKLNELTTSLDQVNERINSTVSSFLVAVAELDEDAANNAAYNMFAQRYGQTLTKYENVKEQTVNNAAYNEHKYASLKEEIAAKLDEIKIEIDQIGESAESAYSEGMMTEILSELTDELDAIDSALDALVKDFNDNTDKLSQVTDSYGTPTLVLTSDAPFYNSDKYTADVVTYTRNFSKQTQKQTSAGWETIVLPFDVFNILTEDGRLLAPFGSELVSAGAALPFWLAEYKNGGFVNTTSIKANVPYIISMPNSEDINRKYRISGNITFYAHNTTVHASSELQAVECADGFTFTPAYDYVEASESVYAINDDVYTYGATDYMPGSVFVKNSRTVRPFEAYMSLPATDSNAHKRFIPVFDGEIDGIQSITVETSGESIYDLSGRRVNTLRPGVNIIRNGNKATTVISK